MLFQYAIETILLSCWNKYFFIEDSLRFIILNYMKHNKYTKEFPSSTAEINYHRITFSVVVCYVPTMHKVMFWLNVLK